MMDDAAMANSELKSPLAEKPAGQRRFDWSLPLAIVGTLAGAAIGAWAFSWLLKHGLYAIMLPGILAGLGGGYPLKRRLIFMGAFAAVVGIAAMIFAEWSNRPFAKDESLAFFLAHLHHLKRAAILMMVLGAGAAFWFGMGRDERT